jgi:ribosomal protein S12 methylthiotransferase accessory factor
MPTSAPIVIKTDQSVAHGGDGTAPKPFELFLASLATCAGIYVLGFCQARGIPTTGIELVQRHHFEEATHLLDRVDLEIVLPQDFPEKYRSAIERAAAGCKVKTTLAAPPEIAVTTTVRAVEADQQPNAGAAPGREGEANLLEQTLGDLHRARLPRVHV